MLNNITLIGRLTKEPELRYTPNGKAVARFTLAIARSYKNTNGEREVDFIEVVTWGKIAEHCANYLRKGKLAAVQGELHIEKWEKDGARYSKPVVNANIVKFLSPKDDETINHAATYGVDINSADDDLPF